GSKATHKRIKAHYNALGQQIPVPPAIREEDLKPQSEQPRALLALRLEILLADRGRHGDLLPQRVVMGLDALV
ncbi:hypothetical protein, partial [Aeromonas hydrophila]|uniref:hypothetical protein n=1 Tax=Aeromonas hydrophila TaxID=644 RepID=UPI0040392DE0